MKSYHSIVLAASILGLCAFSQGASAATVSIANQVFTGNAPLVGTPSPASQAGIVSQSVTGSIIDVELSPYAFNTGAGPDGSAAATSAPYSVLGAGGGSGSATYNVNSNSFTLLWGSPDPYNQIAFFTGSNGTGALLDVIGGNTTNYNGSSLACFASTCTDTFSDLVTFVASGGNIGSVVLTDNVSAAFEFGFEPSSATPLPAALPLFATGLGALGFARLAPQAEGGCKFVSGSLTKSLRQLPRHAVVASAASDELCYKTTGCPASISTSRNDFEGDHYETLAICRTLALAAVLSRSRSPRSRPAGF